MRCYQTESTNLRKKCRNGTRAKAETFIEKQTTGMELQRIKPERGLTAIPLKPLWQSVIEATVDFVSIC